MSALGFSLPPIVIPSPYTKPSNISCKCSMNSSCLSVDIKSKSAADTVKQFYTAINNYKLDEVAQLIADDCVYEDLVFSKPFIGRQATVEFFKKFKESTSPELVFVIDDISDGTSSVGVTWHLDWRGNAFPFSKGCSFYRCQDISGVYKIVYGRDCVEPAFKVNMFALKAIGAVTWLFERFPRLAEYSSR